MPLPVFTSEQHQTLELSETARIVVFYSTSTLGILYAIFSIFVDS